MLRLVKKLNFSSIFVCLAFIFLFGLLLGNSFSYLDPDFAWHLKVGEWISANREVPRANLYNYTYAGDWVDHEWLSNLGLFGAYNSLGYLGVNIIFSLIGLLIFLLLYKQSKMRVRGVSKYLLLFFILLAFLASAPSFGVRIQMLGVLFLLFLLALFRFYEVRRKLWSISLAVPLFSLWSMTHASFLMGIFVFAAWVAYKIGEHVFSGTRLWPSFFLTENIFSRRDIFLVLCVLFFSFLITWCTPYRGELYHFLEGYGNTFYMNYIQEWKSQFSYPFFYWQLLYLSLGASALILSVTTFRRGGRKINAWEMFLFVLFFILSFKSRRHVPLFVAVSFVPIISTFKDFSPVSGVRHVGFKFWQKAYIISVLSVVIILKFFAINYVRDVWSGFCSDYPCGAASFLERNPEYDKHRLFNEYSAGGFLIGRLPERLLFIDGRLPQVAVDGRTFLEKYLDFYRSSSDKDALFDSYNIRLALVSAQDKSPQPRRWEKIVFRLSEQDFKGENALNTYLASSSAWSLIYQDTSYRLYFRP